MDSSKRNLVFAIGGSALLVVLLLFGVRACNASRAESAIREAQSWIANVEKHYADLHRHAERSKTIHARYLGPLGVELDTARAGLAAAKQILASAKAANDSSEKIEKAEVAQDTAKKAERRIVERQVMLNDLDSARTGYRSTIISIQNGLDDWNRRYNELRSHGYREQHFVHAAQVIATVQASFANDLGFTGGSSASIPSNPDEVDYWKIRNVGPPLAKLVRDARVELDGVPALAAHNTRNADRLLISLGEARGLYREAQTSAAALESYPNYRCLDSVAQGFASLVRIEADIAYARRRNDMELQDFDTAQALLTDAQARMDMVARRFREAIARRIELRRALDTFDEKDSAVSRSVERAREHISGNSQNSQNDAERSLKQARDLRREAQDLKRRDPIAALQKLEDARQKADQAYRAVDTSTRVSVSIDNDDDDSPTSLPSPLGGGGGFGSSGPSHSSPVERSPSGGGFRADEPSGGGFRGNDSPSGGGFRNEGPSGGGFRGE